MRTLTTQQENALQQFMAAAPYALATTNPTATVAAGAALGITITPLYGDKEGNDLPANAPGAVVYGYDAHLDGKHIGYWDLGAPECPQGCWRPAGEFPDLY
jgi:hypothetical protein